MDNNTQEQGKFKLNLSKDEISLKNAIERILDPIYEEEIHKAFYQGDEMLKNKLVTLAKEQLQAV